MSDELAVIPNADLVRARSLATQHVHAGYAITAFGAAMLVAPWLAAPTVVSLTIALTIAGIIGAGYGLGKLVPALRARRSIDKKLDQQALPPARLLT